MRKNVKYIFGGIIALIVLSGCKTTDFFSRVFPLQKGEPVMINSVVYALPRTVLRVQVEAVKTIRKKGPYYDYRGKFLNLTEGIAADQVEWSLSGVDITEYFEIDPEQYYVVESNRPFVSNVLQMTRAGLILTPDGTLAQQLSVVRQPVRERPERMLFTEMSVRENYKTIIDTVIQPVVTDTGYVNIPVAIAREEMKTREEMAEDAAETIRSLRMERFRILTGQPPEMIHGAPVDLILEKIARMESLYLSLFIGQSYSEVYKAEYEIIPDDYMRDSGFVLFRFSPEKGLLTTHDTLGTPVTVRLQVSEESPVIQEQQFIPVEKNETEPLRLYYRLPATVRVSLSDDRRILGEKNIRVYQYGKLIRVTQNFVLTGGT